MIRKCHKCKPHSYQDAKYNGLRVFNPCRAPGSKRDGSAWVCTVCGEKDYFTK